MRKLIDDERLMMQVCELFYNQDLTQSEIAAKLQISRPTIAKTLKLAKALGVVRITIASAQGRNHAALEQKLAQTLGIKDVVIVEEWMDEVEQKEALGRATAAYLNQIIRQGDTIGVSMGSTLSYIAQYVQPTARLDKTMFIPIVGGVGQIAMHLHANHISEKLAKAFGGSSFQFDAPAVVGRVQTKHELMQESFVKRAFEKMNHINIALLAVGNLEENSTMLKAGYYSKEALKEAKKQGAIGDICLTFFDENGETEKFESNEKVIAVDLKTLNERAYSIVVLAGKEKAQAAYAAVLGKLVNVLILDYGCAQALEEMSEGQAL